MTRAAPDSLPARDDVSHVLPAIVLLFAGSGCAALMYQIVWLQLLQLVIGSSAISMAVLLAAFMGGMCIGSALAPRFIAVRRHPLRAYAALELGIGSCALALLFAVPFVHALYATTGGGITVRAIVAVACLLPPTIMMGATLPAIARWVESSRSGIAWLGFFCGGNLAGAVAGTLLAGFYLLRVFDMAVTTFVAVAINAAVAAASLLLARRVPHVLADGKPSSSESSSAIAADASTVRLAGYVAAASGFTALAAEVVWTRLLSLAVGATVYAFSLILASFLMGLGIGSSIGAALARRAERPFVLLAFCQLLLCAALAWAGFALTGLLPRIPLTPAPNPWLSLGTDLIRCLQVVVPGAVLWGASFPLALAAAARGGQDTGRLVGRLYAWNTFGAIAGSAAAVWLTASADSQQTQRALVVVSAASAAMAFSIGDRDRRPVWTSAAAGGGALAAVLLAWTIAPVPPALMAYGRHAASWTDVTTITHSAEGLNTFVAVSRTPSGAPVYHAAGKVQASSEGEDMRLQRLLAHLSHLLSDRPTRVMVIGLGAGITAGSIAIAPDVERVTIVEIERLVPGVTRFFADYNYDVVSHPKVQVRIDDARHELLTSRERFDVITSDLVDPWVKGTAALFTREFFESARDHLAPGGMFTMFVQLYLSNVESVKSEIATFLEVFPHTVIWGNTLDGQGYDLVLTGRVEPFTIDVDRMQRTLDAPANQEIARSLRDIGFGSAIDVLSTFAGTGAQLRPWLADAVINRDRNLRLQYLAGLGMDLQQSAPIYAEMLRHARFPDDLFVGTPDTIRALKDGIERASSSALAAPRERQP